MTVIVLPEKRFTIRGRSSIIFIASANRVLIG